MNIVTWADLHIDHLKAAEARGFTDLKVYQEKVCDAWNDTVKPRTTIIVVGDAALYQEGLQIIKKLPGKKILVLGNHDKERHNTIRDILDVFDDVEGMWKHPRRGIWFQHSPMHPATLGNRRQVHGHEHDRIIRDERYINVCWDLLQDGPVDFEKIVSGEYRTYRNPTTATDVA